MQSDLKRCLHRRYTVDVPEQAGRCIDCGIEGRMQFVGSDQTVAWNTRVEGDVGQRCERVLRMYVVSFCALIESLAVASDIDLADTEMTIEANGKQLAAQSVEQMIADAKKLAGVGANHDN